jgi:hypothetical protein
MVIGYDVGERTNHDSHINDFPPKSHFWILMKGKLKM